MNAFISTIGPTYLLSNYGSFFQHLCLRAFLAEQGYTVARWRSYDVAPGGFEWMKIRFIHVLHRIYWVFRLPPGFEELRDGQLDTDRMICKFRREYRRLVGPLEERNDIGTGDLCVLGSDQVLGWESSVWFDGVEGCTKIVYAGSADWRVKGADPHWQSEVRRLFPSFAGVGLREQAGVDVVNRLDVPGVTAVKVVDPVLLMPRERFCALAAPRVVFSRPTLFCYLVNVHNRAELHLAELEDLAGRLNCDLKIVGIQGAMGYIPRRYRLLLAPTAFLAAYRDAKYVVTNSFHGTVFALQFEKPFLTMRQVEEPGCAQNVRQQELLSDLGLQDRWLSFDSAPVDVMTAMVAPIHYEGVRLAIAHMRTTSINWLEEALRGT